MNVLLGEPISDLLTLNSIDKNRTVLSKASRAAEKSPSEIGFVRSRMLYARAALNARGLVQFGLRHIRMCVASMNFVSPTDMMSQMF